MATYRNTIVITDISWNDLSGNKLLSGTLSTNTEPTLRLAQGRDAIFKKTTFYNNGTSNNEIIGTGKFTYNISNKFGGQDNGFFYDLSGSFNTQNIPNPPFGIVGGSGQLFIDSSGGTLVGGFTVNNNPTNIITINTDDRQYTGITYEAWDDLSNNFVSNQFISNILYNENDDAGGPIYTAADPGFIPMGEPITIRSQLLGTVGNARVRVSGSTSSDPGAPGFNKETIAIINGTSIATYYASNSNGGLWIGIDPEPTLNDNDYLYTFFADSNCYHSQTILETEIGPMCIKDIKRGMLVKTRNGFKKVVRVLSNGCKLKDFVVFEKGSLGENIPNQDLMITKGHPVYYQGKYLNCLEFVKNNFFDKIYVKRLETDGLHHIQFETHECVLTNNLWTTSLPHNMGNKIPKELYFDKSLYNPDDKGKHYPPYCLHVDPPNDELDDDELEEIMEYN